MAQLYVYLVSSLPMLNFGARPPFSFEAFIESAQGKVSESDLDLLKNLPSVIDERAGVFTRPVIREFIEFDTELRNELVRIRAHSKKKDAQIYLRPQSGFFSEIPFIAAAAHRNPHVLDAEISLDAARWARLDQLSLGHFFDLDILIIYAYKLKILERWAAINSADKERLLANAETIG